MTDKDLARPTINLILATKDVMERDLSLGLVNEEQLRLTITSRQDIAKELKEKGLSQREIAKLTGVSQSQVARDLNRNGSKSEPEGIAEIRKANEEKRKEELARPVASGLVPGLHHGDFRELHHCIESESVQLVFTDPPYNKDAINLYRDAASIAARILKPGGSFIAYSGQKHLPRVYSECSNYLTYWWTIAGVHAGQNQMLQKLGVRCGWKPLVWFVKETRGDVQNVLHDVISGAREKDSHEWQQAEAEASYYIEKLTTEGGLIVDFFAGSGTTLAAAKKLGRQWIGFEIDKKSVISASRRIEAAA